MTRSSDDAPPTPRVIPLSPGEPNTATGTAPDRVFAKVSRAELHAFEIADPLADVLICPGGGIVLERDADGRVISADCFTRDGFLLTDCNLSVWKKLKTKGLIASISGGPYRVNRDGLARMRSQLDNRVSARRW